MNRSLDPMPSVAELKRMYRERTGVDAALAERGRFNRHPESAAARNLGGYRSKWEAEYAGRLIAMQRAGLIRAWQYEARRFVVGVRRTYKPDFRVVHLTRRIEYVEVKGSPRAKNARDSLTRLSVVAMQYPHLSFTLATKHAGTWHETPLAA